MFSVLILRLRVFALKLLAEGYHSAVDSALSHPSFSGARQNVRDDFPPPASRLAGRRCGDAISLRRRIVLQTFLHIRHGLLIRTNESPARMVNAVVNVTFRFPATPKPVAHCPDRHHRTGQ